LQGSLEELWPAADSTKRRHLKGSGSRRHGRLAVTPLIRGTGCVGAQADQREPCDHGTVPGQGCRCYQI